jgi:Holliday junction resolvase RusA-like endonuclease
MRHFIVPDKATPKQRPRFFRGRPITPEATLLYEAKVASCYTDAHGHLPEFTGDVSMSVFFFFNDRRRRDLDNCVKAVADGLNKTNAFKDDVQLKHIEAFYIIDKSEPERAEVFLEELDESFPLSAVTALKNMSDY